MALLAIVSIGFQSFTVTASSLVPISYFAPVKLAPQSPFVWIPPLPNAPFLTPVPQQATGWADFQRPALPPRPAPIIAAAPWQPAEVDENAPLAPPDGVPIAPADGFPGPLPGINQAVGNSTITGEVSDATSLNPIAGAFVDVMGTGRTAQTDTNGRFTIGGLPAGTFTLEASKLGYSTETSVITTLEGQPAQARFGLRLKPADDTAEETMLEEETIVGEYSDSSQGDLFLSLDATPSISAGISREDFSRAAVSDAAGAVSKISGANIVGGRYAVIRGLGDRYSNTTLNGSLISSADPSRKAVQLDLFPSHLLESIKIDKNFLPYMPAEFAGGLVGIQTMRFPDKPIIDFKVGLDANSNLGKGDDFYVIKGRDLGFWGNSNEGALPKERLRLLDFTTGTATAAQRKAVMESVHSSQGFRPEKDDPDAYPLSLEATLGRTFELTPGVRLGVIAAFTHEKGDEATIDKQVGRQFARNPDVNSRSYTVDEYTRYVEWGGLISAGLKIGEQHEIGYTYFTNNNSSDTVSLSTDVKDQETSTVTIVNGQPVVNANIRTSQGVYGAAYAIYRGFDQIEPLFRSLDVNQLSGRHSFDEEDRGPVVDWALAFSDSLEERPQTSTFYTTQLDFTDPRIQSATYLRRVPNPAPPPRNINVVTPEVYEPSRGIQQTVGDPLLSNPPDVESFRESLKTAEEATDVNLAMTLPYYFDENSDNRFELKFGGASFEKKREVRGDFVVYRIPQGFNSAVYQNPADNGQFGIDDAANIDSLQLPNGSDRFTGTVGGLQYVDFTGRGFTERNVNASTKVDSTFLMGGLHVDKWELSGGFRSESESRGYELLTESGVFREGDEQSGTNNLFGITLIRTLGDEDNHAVQVAVSRTIARPTFYEFAPVIITDQATGETTVGNPDLVDSLIDNFDISYSYTPKPGVRYAVNLFHKDVDAPIVKVREPLDITSWINAQNGSIQGVELEAEKRFGDHWSLTANYTYLNSLLEIKQEVAGEELEFESTFEGQPDQIANIILGYDHADWGIRTSLVYNYTGQFFVALSNNPLEVPSVVQLPSHTLDFVISKDFTAWGGYDGVISFKVTNLLDADVERINEGVSGINGIYDKYSPGQSYSLSCKISF